MKRSNPQLEMTYKCKKCEMEFNTEKALKAHQKVHQEKPKRAPKTKKAEPGQTNKKGERVGQDGTALLWPDGKSKTFKSYLKRMRQSHPEIKKGDKLPSKEVRKLLKHSKKLQTAIKGAKLEVMDVKEMNNGMTRYRLENNKICVMWSEGLAFANNKKSKFKSSHFITHPMIVTKK